MKIAIPSNDNKTISKHFGKSEGFVIAEIKENEVINKEYKKNDFTHHAKGGNRAHDHEHHENHSHDSILKALEGCSVVIAGGMGRRLYSDFEQNKITVYLTQEDSVDTALNLYIKGTLDNNLDARCNH
ncbi:MAG: iron-molybdenum cofactor biosynthesis protein [Treponema sp.]|nr:MAG: iron-molybdenum cofactor biosynthesis protein [Treponema sp.]